jgi:uncharacterized protein YwgA
MEKQRRLRLRKLQLRQALPLLLCYADQLDPIQGRTRMQKIFFLFEKELGTTYFKFEAADYGPFSWRLSKDVDFLVASGYLAQRTRTIRDGGEKFEYSITKRGADLVKRALSDAELQKTMSRQLDVLTNLKRQNNHRNLRQLLREVYSRYPEYAVKSRAAI